MSAWTVEQTGGGCTADVARVRCDRTGQNVALVVTDGDAGAWTRIALSPLYRSLCVGVYADGAWWGDDDDDREPLVIVFDDGDDTDLCALLMGALGDAGVVFGDLDPHGHSETVHALAVALLDARTVQS